MDVGPLISREAKARCERLIQSGIDQGAKCLLDGRGVKVSTGQGPWRGCGCGCGCGCGPYGGAVCRRDSVPVLLCEGWLCALQGLGVAEQAVAMRLSLVLRPQAPKHVQGNFVAVAHE